MSRPVIILGGGGHAKVLIDALKRCCVPIIGITDRVIDRTGSRLMEIEIIGTDEAVEHHAPGEILLVNGIGSVQKTAERRALYERFKNRSYTFAKVVHPAAIVASDVLLAEGVQVMAGAVIQPGCSIGENSLINTGANMDHDCIIGSHVHLAPGVTLSGDVHIGNDVHVGSGSTIIQGIRIGDGALIAAGAVVTRDVPPGAYARSVPARTEDP